MKNATRLIYLREIGGPGRTRTCNQTVMSGWYHAAMAAIPAIVPKITHLPHEISGTFAENGFNEPESTPHVLGAFAFGEA